MNLMTTSSPHIRSKDSTSRIMLDVLVALVPTLVAGHRSGQPFKKTVIRAPGPS